MQDFKEWLISEEFKDIFKFKSPQALSSQNSDDKPVDLPDFEEVCNNLACLNIGTKKSSKCFSNSVEWSDGEQSVLRIRITPWGSLAIVIEKKIVDLTGDPVWVVKKVFPVVLSGKPDEHALTETLYNYLLQIDKEMLEMPSKECGLKSLVLNLAGKIKNNLPRQFIWDSIREVSSNYYIIALNLTGMGIEAPDARKVNQFHIHLTYSLKTGLIRCWGNDISSKTKGQHWTAMPSEWDMNFSPIQSQKEIIDAIIGELRTY